MAGYKINRCMLGVPNEFCGLVRNTGKITPNHPISRQDLQELRKLAAEYPLPASWEISNVIYGDYLADGRPVDNPIGLSCRTLELRASIICIHTDFAKQLTRFFIPQFTGRKMDSCSSCMRPGSSYRGR